MKGEKSYELPVIKYMSRDEKYSVGNVVSNVIMTL